jgi:hypothetical protein
MAAEYFRATSPTRGFQRIEDSVKRNADGRQYAALEACVVDHLDRPCATQYVGDRPQIADCKRID